MTQQPTIFFQEEEIPGVAESPGKNFLPVLYGKGIVEGGWRKFPGRETFPAVRFCGPCDSAFHAASFLTEKKLLSDWDSVLVTSQSAGVGQYGRRWLSPEGNCYLVWRLPDALVEKGDRPGLLPLLLGASMAEALSGFGISAEIKWPNDLVLNDRKVGGMLIKSSPGFVLAGIGINIVRAPDAASMRQGSRLEAGSLSGKDLPASPLEFWIQLFPPVFALMQKAFHREGASELLNMLEKRLWRRNREIRYHAGDDEIFSAHLLGVEKDGGLRLLTEKGEERFYSGSIGMP